MQLHLVAGIRSAKISITGLVLSATLSNIRSLATPGLYHSTPANTSLSGQWVSNHTEYQVNLSKFWESNTFINENSGFICWDIKKFDQTELEP